MSKQIKKYDELYSNIELVPDEAIKDTDDPQGFDVDWDLVEEKYQQHRHGHHHHSSGHSSVFFLPRTRTVSFLTHRISCSAIPSPNKTKYKIGVEIKIHTNR